MRLIMPWPPTTLSPNARVHWAKLAKAKKQYRNACAWTAITQGARRIEAQGLHVSLTFYPPSKRAIDLDNCLARFKAGIDGLVDVLQVDDSRWKLTIEKADQVGGYVEVKILDKDTGQA